MDSCPQEIKKQARTTIARVLDSVFMGPRFLRYTSGKTFDDRIQVLGLKLSDRLERYA